MGKKLFQTEADVEKEIARLQDNPFVEFAREIEHKERDRRRQYMYNLRSLEKKGIELAHEYGLLDEEIEKITRS